MCEIDIDYTLEISRPGWKYADVGGMTGRAAVGWVEVVNM
jgi:hypothetical protein